MKAIANRRSLKLFNLPFSAFSKKVEKEVYFQPENSGNEEDSFSKLNPKIDPMSKQVNDFLKHVSLFEDENKDVERVYYMEQNRLKGFATVEGTEKFYRRSQCEDIEAASSIISYNESLEVHHENFRSPFNSMLKISTLGCGSYMGNPDDMSDYLMYDAIKQSVLSGGINHIDTAPNYRYMKSERTIGKILTTLESKYNIQRN